MTSVRTFIVVVSLVTSQVAPRVLALGADGSDPATEGLRLRRDMKDQEALPYFQQAVRQEATPRSLAQLGLCEQALGLWVDAETHLSMALKDTRDPWMRKNQPALRDALKRVQANLASIDVWGTPRGARVTLDGAPVGSLPLEQPLRVADGRHVVGIEAPQFVPDSHILTVHAGTLVRQHVALAPAAPVTTQPQAAATPAPVSDPATRAVSPAVAERVPVEPATPPDRGVHEWRRVLPWSLVAVAVGAAAIGAWQHKTWNDGIGRFEAIPACGLSAPMRGSDPRCSGIADDFLAARTRAFVAYGAAAALGAAAATVFILNAASDRDAKAGTVAFGSGPGDLGLAASVIF